MSQQQISKYSYLCSTSDVVVALFVLCSFTPVYNIIYNSILITIYTNEIFVSICVTIFATTFCFETLQPHTKPLRHRHNRLTAATPIMMHLCTHRCF